MCGFCSDSLEERKAEQDRYMELARILRRLASSYEDLASFRLDPHGRAVKEMKYLARHLIRLLVEEWL